MSFTATFYNCSDDPKVIGKTLTDGTVVESIVPTDGCDLLSPTFVLDYNSNLTTCNYVVVGAPFNRHYFISDMSIDIGKKIEIKCNVDVLETYADGIKASTACIVRSESVGGPTYIVDNKLPIDPNRKEIKSIKLTGGFTPSYSAGSENILVSMT